MSSPSSGPQRRRPTIADVARRAGVSAAAVSFAVNDRPGVSPGTRERILTAARDLGWQPSASARALTEARTRAVGLVMARSAGQLEGDSFFLRFLSGIESTLTAADYALLLQIVPFDAAMALPAYERLAAAGRVDGFLLTDVELLDRAGEHEPDGARPGLRQRPRRGRRLPPELARRRKNPFTRARRDARAIVDRERHRRRRNARPARDIGDRGAASLGA